MHTRPNLNKFWFPGFAAAFIGQMNLSSQIPRVISHPVRKVRWRATPIGKAFQNASQSHEFPCSGKSNAGGGVACKDKGMESSAGSLGKW